MSLVKNMHFTSSHRVQPLDRFRDMNKMKNFEVIQKLGQGTFGVVQKARYVRSGKVVALKQLLNHSAKEGFPITAMREITIVKKLNHENVLKIIDMIYEAPKVTNLADVVHQRGCFYTVSDYMASDLVGILENPNITLKLTEIKCLMQQLLRGIQYIHDQHYLHRDIKAANILLDSRGVLKIADFGLARLYHGHVPKLREGHGGGIRNYTALVVTRWYRPPEILLGERKYTTAVDMWGVGCVFGELFTHKPILNGKTDSHQCQLIFELLGAPTDEYIASLPNKDDLSIGLSCRRTLEARFEPLIQDYYGVDLLSHLLELSPKHRYNALDALDHKFFSQAPFPAKPSDLKFEEGHEIDKERFQKMARRPAASQRAPLGPQRAPLGPQRAPKEAPRMQRVPSAPRKTQRLDRYVPKPPAPVPQASFPQAPAPAQEIPVAFFAQLAPTPPPAPPAPPPAPAPAPAPAITENPQPPAARNSSTPIVRNSSTPPVGKHKADPPNGIFMPKKKKLPQHRRAPSKDIEDSDLTDFDEDVSAARLRFLNDTE